MSSSGEASIGLRCGCGFEVKLFTSKTKENPGRPFLRCVREGRAQGERHTFKWVEDYLLEELGMAKAEIEELKGTIQEMKQTDFVSQIGKSVLVIAIGVGIGYWFASPDF